MDESLTPSGDPAGELAHLPEAAGRISALPSDLVNSLQQATILGSLDEILNVVSRIREQDPALANELAQLANDYEHDKIMDIIRESGSEP